MELYLQFGYGMMGLVSELISTWGGGGVILSPRDLEPSQLMRVSADVSSSHGVCLIDPQCYDRSANHPRLRKYSYFNQYCQCDTRGIVTGASITALIGEIFSLNSQAGCEKIILPSLFCESPDGLWLAFQNAVVNSAIKENNGSELYATIALSPRVLLNEDSVELLIEYSKKLDVHGFYVVAATGSGYFCDSPVWLSNLLSLISGLKLINKKVIVGYCNHQALCLGAAKADILASGTWLNVRSFGIGRYSVSDEDDHQRRTTWYYCPQVLSEYKLPFLDIAKKAGLLDELRPDASYGSNYADLLFSGPDPTAVDWKEPFAFRHYLACMKHQASISTKDSFQNTYEFQLELLDRSEENNSKFRKNGILGATRDFHSFFDVNRSALITFERKRGPQLRRYWSRI